MNTDNRTFRVGRDSNGFLQVYSTQLDDDGNPMMETTLLCNASGNDETDVFHRLKVTHDQAVEAFKYPILPKSAFVYNPDGTTPADGGDGRDGNFAG